MQIGMMQSTRVVGPKSSYVVPRSGPPEVVTVGEPPEAASARLRILTAHYARQSKQTAAAYQQRWFRGQASAARRHLRSILAAASETLLIVDRYFGPEEVGEFCLAVARSDVRISILSSTRGLKELVTKDGEREKGEALTETLERLRTIDRPPLVEVRLMGDDPVIHDRFIAVDARVWHLGASLHDFGERGTMLQALADPDEVLPHLLAVWDAATPLAVWIGRRREERKRASSGVP